MQGSAAGHEESSQNDDERDVAPMSLDIIERALQLWSNPGDVVLDPFSGVGSTGYVALQRGRRFHGYELKTSYYQQAAKNLASVVQESGKQQELFAAVTA